MEYHNFKETIAESPCIFVIGVAGDSGSGKTTFTRAIREIFGDDLVTTIPLDDYHRYDRETRRRLGVTPLAPEANDLERLEVDLCTLKSGGTIRKMQYNHSSGQIEGPFPFTPSRILILEGLHTLYTPALRRLLDFSLFVDPEDEVKREWKMQRDVSTRNYSDREVEEERSQRKEDYIRHIAPQRAFADAVIRIYPTAFRDRPGGVPGVYRITLCQVPLEERVNDVSLNIDLFSILSLSDRDFSLSFSVEQMDGRRMGALTCDGELPYDTVRKLERSIEHHTGVSPITLFENLRWVNAGDLIRLVLSWRIINRRIMIGKERNGECWNPCSSGDGNL
jgi:phosphoribulokinase